MASAHHPHHQQPAAFALPPIKELDFFTPRYNQGPADHPTQLQNVSINSSPPPAPSAGPAPVSRNDWPRPGPHSQHFYQNSHSVQQLQHPQHAYTQQHAPLPSSSSRPYDRHDAYSTVSGEPPQKRPRSSAAPNRAAHIQHPYPSHTPSHHPSPYSQAPGPAHSPALPPATPTTPASYMPPPPLPPSLPPTPTDHVHPHAFSAAPSSASSASAYPTPSPTQASHHPSAHPQGFYAQSRTASHVSGPSYQTSQDHWQQQQQQQQQHQQHQQHQQQQQQQQAHQHQQQAQQAAVQHQQQQAAYSKPTALVPTQIETHAHHAHPHLHPHPQLSRPAPPSAMAPPSGVVGTVPAPAPMDMRKADMRAVEMDKMNQVQGTMSEIARECGILVDFAARYAELQARQPNVHPSPEEVTEMSERAGHVVRLIEELRRLAHPAIVIPPIPAAALSASAASSPSVVSTSGGGAQEDHRGPKRPWEDMASSSGEAQEARASAEAQSMAEADMELIRTKRATTTGAAGVSGQQKTKYRKRSRATPPGKCHSCNIRETPEWRRGPDGARTLCNACGLHYAKLMRKKDKNSGPPGSAGEVVDMESVRASVKAGSGGANGNGNGEGEGMDVEEEGGRTQVQVQVQVQVQGKKHVHAHAHGQGQVLGGPGAWNGTQGRAQQQVQTR